MAEDADEDQGDEGDLGAGENAGSGDMPPVDFNLLVLSLNASALIHLGDAGEGENSRTGGDRRADLPMARNAIDMLCMLEVKTRGNLSGEEERLLEQVLFDLRLRYARKAQG